MKINSKKQAVLLLVCVLCFCFAQQSVEAKSKADTDRFEITVINKYNEPIKEAKVLIKTSLEVKTKYTNSDGIAKFKVEKEPGEAPLYWISKDTYINEHGALTAEVRNVKGNLIVTLYRKGETTNETK